MSQSPPSQLTVRFATLLDVPALAHICTTGLASDEVFDYVYPGRHDHPNEHLFYWQERFKSEILDPGTAVLVAELGREAVSFATWSLTGACRSGRRASPSWTQDALFSVFRWTSWIQSRLLARLYGPRRDLDFDRRQNFVRMSEELHARYYPPAQQSYHLSLLATAERHRRKGAATALIEWAVENAAADGAIVGTEPSLSAESFYKHRGFVEVGELAIINKVDEKVHLRVPVLRYDGTPRRSDERR